MLLVQEHDVNMALVGEDQRSIDKNITLMVAECKKAHPDKPMITSKMQRSAPYRHRNCAWSRQLL